MLESLRDKMITEVGWSRMHINKQVSRLVRVFKWASSKELVEPSIPMGLVKLPVLRKGRCKAKETPVVTCVDDAIVEKTSPKLSKIVSGMVKLQRLTAARSSEICSICPCDINRNEDVWIYFSSEHKTKHHEKDRITPIGPKGRQIRMRYLNRSLGPFCYSTAEAVQQKREEATLARKTSLSCGNRPGTNPVANPKRKPSGRHMTDSCLRATHRACESLKIEKWSPNRLRHTSAAEMRRRFGLEAAQVICGHESAEVTQVYAERDLELAKKVAREVRLSPPGELLLDL
jgi:integrase